MPLIHTFLWSNRSTLGRVLRASRLTGYPYTVNINKFNLSLASCKLSRLLKMIIYKAVVHQRHQYLTAKIVCSTTKQESKPFTRPSYQTRGGIVLPNMFVDIFVSCMCAEWAWWLIKPKKTLLVQMSKKQTCKGNFCASAMLLVR